MEISQTHYAPKSMDLPLKSLSIMDVWSRRKPIASAIWEETTTRVRQSPSLTRIFETHQACWRQFM